MPKIYTKTGDDGTTFCPPFGRVPKSHSVVVAQGEIDELNSWIGVIRSKYQQYDGFLHGIQLNLLKLGADICYDNKMVKDANVTALEEKIDEFNKKLSPLKHFILPHQSPEVHVARSVCRRAERSTCSIIGITDDRALVAAKYLNRLSDFLFVLARTLSKEDEIWNEKS